MAREESEREDLLYEATALVERVKFIPPNADPIVAGFRADGACSIFFGEDPAYHFNAAGELRRAYCGGLLIKAVNRRLVSLRRERTEHETHLMRPELTATEQTDFVSAMQDRLHALTMLFAGGELRVARQVPLDVNVSARVRTWLDEHRDPAVASRPNA